MNTVSILKSSFTMETVEETATINKINKHMFLRLFITLVLRKLISSIPKMIGKTIKSNWYKRTVIHNQLMVRKIRPRMDIRNHMDLQKMKTTAMIGLSFITRMRFPVILNTNKVIIIPMSQTALRNRPTDPVNLKITPLKRKRLIIIPNPNQLGKKNTKPPCMSQ